MRHHAFADRAGVIEFGRFVPDGRLPIASHDDQALLQSTIEAIARHAYDGKTLLVPGIPEADTDEAALEAMLEFNRRAAERLQHNVAGLLALGARMHQAAAELDAELEETGQLTARRGDPLRELEPAECEECGGTGIARGAITFDAGDGEGEDRPCPACSH